MIYHLIQLKIKRGLGAYSRLLSPNARKGFIWRMFGHLGLPINEGGFLFRTYQNDDGMVLLVHSEHQPRVDVYPGDVEVAARRIDYRLQEGDEIRFNVLCSPSKSQCQPKEDGKRKRGLKIGMPLEETPGWLARQFDGVARVEFLTIQDVGWQITENRRGNRISLPYVEMSGTFHVENIQEFERIIRVGIGRGKRFGFGFVILSGRSRQ